MKRILKSTVALTMALLMALCGTASAFATENTEANDVSANVSAAAITPPTADINVRGNVSTSWKTVYSSTSGMNCWIDVGCTNPSLERTDIRMLGKNGNVLWTEIGSLAPTGSKKYWCGSDVYKVQFRSQGGTSVVIVNPLGSE